MLFRVSQGEEMPIKDYFEVQEVEEEVLNEDAKHAKVIEFVYQVRQRDIALQYNYGSVDNCQALSPKPYPQNPRPNPNPVQKPN